MIASTPKLPDTSLSTSVVIKYHVHCKGSDSTLLAGSSILSGDSVCLLFESCPNQNLFQHFFGLEFHHDGHTYVCAISTYKFARCFNLIDKVQYPMFHKRYKFGLDAAMPVCMSAWLLEHVNSHLVYLCNSNSKIFLPNQFAVPAAPIQTLVNGTICTRLPSKEQWIQAYANDTELCAVQDLALNLSTITNQTLSKVNHNYCTPLRHSLISFEDNMLILRKPISRTSSFTCLQLAPTELINIIFIAFHTNPIGGHLNAYRTLHHL
jgi:hypothetical protein